MSLTQSTAPPPFATHSPDVEKRNAPARKESDGRSTLQSSRLPSEALGKEGAGRPAQTTPNIVKLSEQLLRVAKRVHRADSEPRALRATSAPSKTCPCRMAAASAAAAKLTEQKGARIQPDPDPRMTRAAVHSEAIARQWIERVRWPNGPVCPRCRGTNVVRLCGAASLLGQLNCRRCRRKFTVTVGTPMARSQLQLRVWVRAMQFVSDSPRCSVDRLRRELGGRIPYVTAASLLRRLRRNKKSKRP